MTDIKLLPPPKWLLEGFTDQTIERLCDYTQANVAHTTKALRAELETAKGQAEFYRTERNKNQQKAERLEEALRKVDKQLDDVECESSADAWAVDRCRDTIEAALNQKEVPTMSDEVMKCPYCGEAAQVADRVEINLETYRGSVRARTDCCGSIIRVYPILRLRAEKTDQGGRDDWGH